MTFKKVLIVSAVLAAAFGAQAQQSGSFGVTGTVTTQPCSITLSGGGVADFGAQQKSAVQAMPIVGSGAAYQLSTQHPIPITVQCTAPTRFVMGFADNKAAARTPLGTVDDVLQFGMTDGAGTATIGGYYVNLASVTADGAAPAGFLHAAYGSTAWGTTNAGTAHNNYVSNQWTSGVIKTAGVTVPDPVTTLGGNLTINAVLNKAYVDAATAPITLSGSGTVTIFYI